MIPLESSEALSKFGDFVRILQNLAMCLEAYISKTLEWKLSYLLQHDSARRVLSFDCSLNLKRSECTEISAAEF